MQSLKNATYRGSENRSALIDLSVPDNFNQKLILFLHAYMGYKDWGAWELMEKYFTGKGFGFCRFNFTHNGGTIDNGIDFPDLEAFAENNYSKEVRDVQHALDWLEEKLGTLPEVHLLGHSRGGGIALLSAEDKRITSVITLSGICSVAQRFEGEAMISDWKEKGIRYVMNKRTMQQMPHNYSQVIDFQDNREMLDIEKTCRNLNKPVLAIHGDSDTSVSTEEGMKIAAWTNTRLCIIPGADHVFGASQPWNEDSLPRKLEDVCGEIESFL